MKRSCVWLLPVLALGLVLSLAAGCGTAPKVPPSGFLSNYKALRPDPDVKGLYWWERKGVDWTHYRALLIDPVQVRISPAASKKFLEPGEAARMAAKLRQVVIKALRGNYPLATRPAPGVLRLRAALVHLKPVQPVANVVSSVILMVPVDVGEAAVEVQFTDSVSGRIQGELVISSQGSVTQFSKVWTRWDQVEDAFMQWAIMLRKAMREGK